MSGSEEGGPSGLLFSSVEVVLVAALSSDGVIGIDGRLPWHLPDDLRRFRALTLDGTVVMGRATFESIGRPLPRRRNLVLSRSLGPVSGVEVVRSVADVAARVTHGSLFVIGGAQVYRAFLPWASRLELTRVQAHVEGDTWFPEWSADVFECVAAEAHPADGQHMAPCRFETYRRRASAPKDG